VKQTWKSSSYSGGPVKNVAVAAMTGRDFYRQAIENHFAALLKEQGQSAFTSHQLIGVPRKKEERETAAARLREAGADSVLVVRLVSSDTYSRQARGGPPAFTSSAEESYGYFFMGSEAAWNSTQTDVYIESSLHALASGERLWSGVTRTVLKENADSIEKIKPLARKLFTLMRQDGVIH
jgi:hypothetical protein